MTSCLTIMYKDTNSFVWHGNVGFFRRSLVPSNINGCFQDDEITEIFRNSFSGV